MVQIALTGLFVFAVFILVLIHVFGFSASDVKNLFASDSKKPAVETKKSTPKVKPKSKVTKKVVGTEVRQYSEFISVQHPTLGLTISTGIRYDNSTNQKVVAQWCYVQKTKAQNDGFSVHLSLRKIEGSKTQNFEPYSVQTLREFDLTHTQAANLISYCRFK